MARSNIHPKALRRTLKHGFETLLDGFVSFLKAEGQDRGDRYVQIFAGRTGLAVGGRFNRMGSGTLAALWDVGIIAEPAAPIEGVVELGGTVGSEGEVGKGWGHSGDAELAEFTQGFVVAVPRDMLDRVDVAEALHALASAPIKIHGFTADDALEVVGGGSAEGGE